uniref:Uncharacterized protein LOC111134959 n=1 Tax=Crassostrea virginica TaxID=6565 RepID=A0A8B8EKM8_CRAVI|nr:uncharacterized protein LOC111134959 [Crassostrea virginica]
MLDGTCQECPVGFWDDNCSRVCQYPNFGINCLQTCQCIKRLCDNIRGCPDNITTNNPHSRKNSSVVNGQMTVTTFKTSLETMAEKKEIKSKKKSGSNKNTVFLAITAVLALIVIIIASLEVFIGRKQRIGERYVVESHNL